MSVRKTHKSCNCHTCRMMSSDIKKMHKKVASKKDRLKAKKKLKEQDDTIHIISTGYKA